jgi:uroporphyrinogen III methyltransferase / synthase
MQPEIKAAMVYLIGAGPGDPGLITLKGARCIAAADVVVYDYLASSALLRHARDDAELIYVGKKGGDHTLSQDAINALLVEKALQGRSVARLKGGDPFIFGRGGEEAQALIDKAIPFEVVPGVTSAVAAPAYAGIPLTHRRFTSTVTFVTGHEDPTKDATRIDWTSLASGTGTLVFLMGVKNLPHIVQRLLDNGRSPSTPVALVRWGTTARQKTVVGQLDDIVERVAAAGLKAPAIIVVGDVARLRQNMAWFEPRRPLLGKCIVVTRARQQASDLVERLSDLGAECIECPTIEIVPPMDESAVDLAIDRLGEYDWVIFTSVNGVAYFFRRLLSRGLDSRALGGMRTAAIGPATAARLMDFGIRCDIVPETYRAESVVAAFEGQAIKGCRILLPRAKEARPVLPQALSRMGARVDEVTVYQTRLATETAGEILTRLDAGQIDLVTFTSSSTVKNFLRIVPPDRLQALIESVTVAAIGPITAQTARENGLSVHVTADRYTIDGLCQSIAAHYLKSADH